MKLDRRYWILIGAAVFFATVSSASTLYLASIREGFRECNSAAAACFTGIGMIPCMILGVLSLIPVMIAVPYALRQNEQPGLLSTLILLGIVAYTAFDATNNISAILGFRHSYQIAHSVLSTTNNVTGTVIGTGESLC